ncbi:MAG: heavy-metal-associated domain-containing protein [Desulfobacterales bacterium]|nr:heavy-metal-associated domain-containing protein [Desulfobacterales bacterium]
MTCANCAATVERVVKKLAGVDAARVNFASEQAAVTFDPKAVALPQIVASDPGGADIPSRPPGSTWPSPA